MMNTKSTSNALNPLMLCTRFNSLSLSLPPSLSPPHPPPSHPVRKREVKTAIEDEYGTKSTSNPRMRVNIARTLPINNTFTQHANTLYNTHERARMNLRVHTHTDTHTQLARESLSPILTSAAHQSKQVICMCSLHFVF